ncbi:hypothetical protein HRE53_05465 [Acaryochloris sp. 'Moss Beach']|uniref:hypothetical protein n=1 Tax=Acaryochloris sp. 'Moss Beach' TaxID=2740837 RepID=UPI001F279D7C|nr:hypothetical protein [Acaryochloris sp. 'Moss Beach']UJB70540.1 hypothetical protein HRE53_05465 [Acaryochloris sp. 'Moss Beach']
MLKKIGLVAFLLLLGGGGWLAYTWQQVTHLPDWYTRESTPETAPSTLLPTQIDDPAEIESLAFGLHQKVDRVLSTTASQTPEVQLTAQEFNQFVVTSLPAQARSPKVITSVKAMNTKIEAGQLQTGIVVDTSTLPLDQLPSEYQATVKGLLQSFPVLQDKEIYVGVEGKPQVQQGKVVLGEDARLVVGNVRFSYGDIRDRINLPTNLLDSPVNLQLGQLQIKDLNFQDQTVILKGQAQ